MLVNFDAIANDLFSVPSEHKPPLYRPLIFVPVEDPRYKLNMSYMFFLFELYTKCRKSEGRKN